MDLKLWWHKTLHQPYVLYSEAHGDCSKPVIVFLHGIAASSEDWRNLVPLLTGEYYCITIDLLGFANSPKPQWARYTIDEHVRAVHRTIRRYGLGKPFILIGHSLGSLLAARYTREHARSIDRLLLLSPPVYPPINAIQSKIALRRTSGLIKLYKFLRTNPRMTPEVIKRLSYFFPLPKSITKHPDTWIPFFRTLEECIESQTAVEDVRAIHAPIDIFYGTLDQVVISRNIQLLVTKSTTTVHIFRGRHPVGRTYAQFVAKILLP